MSTKRTVLALVTKGSATSCVALTFGASGIPDMTSLAICGEADLVVLHDGTVLKNRWGERRQSAIPGPQLRLPSTRIIAGPGAERQ